MKKERRKEALRAFENYAKTKWLNPGETISELWLAAIEWADNNPDASDVCSATGLIRETNRQNKQIPIC